MTELAGTDRIAPGALEAWRRHLGEEVDPDSLRTELALGSLPRAFHETAARYPERAALTGLGAAAFERLSPHGLRAGFVTKAYRNGSGPLETHA